ncbi:hypothetical protein N9B94_00925 [Verrucomicrobia bacterium]|nr:hypothetical protein [Verrucomicrobiota bacterium]
MKSVVRELKVEQVAFGKKPRFLQQYQVTLVLLLCYLAVFEVWTELPREAVIQTAIGVSSAMALFCLWHLKTGYFRNSVDLIVHLAIPLDVALEGLLIPFHDDRGFLFCALGFALVLIPYRVALAHREGGRRRDVMRQAGGI